MKRASVFTTLVLVACGSSAEPAPPTSAPPTSVAPPPATPTPAAAPTCALDGEPVALSANTGPLSLIALGDAFIAAGFAPRDDAGEDFWIARVAPGAAPVELFRTSVAGPSGSTPVRALGSAPALARIDDTTIAIAVVGRGGEVSAGRATIGEATARVRLVPVEEGAEPLWSPAVAVVGDAIAVAWTQSSTTAPRGHYYRCGWTDPDAVAFDAGPPPPPPHDRQVRLAQLDASDIVRLRRDATPAAAGAWAEGVVTIDGTSPPELVFDDPQSTLAATVHQVGFRGEGFVEPRTVRTLSLMHDASMLAAAAAPGGPWLAYMATGADAHSAVAIVSLGNDAAPTALVEGNTGRMHVDAVSAGDYAVFAAEAGTVAEGQGRDIHVRAVAEGGPGAALVVHGASPSTSSPTLARRASDGLLALAYLDGGAATLRWVRCH